MAIMNIPAMWTGLSTLALAGTLGATQVDAGAASMNSSDVPTTAGAAHDLDTNRTEGHKNRGKAKGHAKGKGKGGICKGLKCTPEQREIFREIQSELREASAGSRSELKAIKTRIELEFRRDRLDRAQVLELFEALNAKRTEIDRAHQSAMMEMHEHLEPDQRGRLAKKAARGKASGKGHGRGGTKGKKGGHGPGKGKGKGKGQAKSAERGHGR